MPEEEPTTSLGTPTCPHCKALQTTPLTTAKTIKVHPCQSCDKTFVIVETVTQFSTVQTIFPPEEPPAPG